MRDELRQALARFAAGVVVVAARADGGVPRSVVASAFNSVSLEPPIVLWCVPSAHGGWLQADRAYGLSVLSSRQASLAQLEDLQREPLAWEYGELLGAPLLRNAAAWFEVVAARRLPHGDHQLYLGEVAFAGYERSAAGLLRYSDRVCRSTITI
jgi:flavin reductase (DIM6/NTAB) family NADH-FMN oxidoreductase RutF